MFNKICRTLFINLIIILWAYLIWPIPDFRLIVFIWVRLIDLLISYQISYLLSINETLFLHIKFRICCDKSQQPFLLRWMDWSIPDKLSWTLQLQCLSIECYYHDWLSRVMCCVFPEPTTQLNFKHVLR